MLKRNTVLVLGAGASAPYHFPTGIELSKQLVAGLGGGGDVANKLQKHLGFGEQQIAHFRDSFFYSGKNSVDAFLEHRREFIEIGKAATAIVLITYEQSWHLFDYNDK